MNPYSLVAAFVVWMLFMFGADVSDWFNAATGAIEAQTDREALCQIQQSGINLQLGDGTYIADHTENYCQ